MSLSTISLSHRVAGPLVRVKQGLRSLANGMAPRGLVSRKHDFMSEEVMLLNKLTQSLRNRAAELKSSGTSLQTTTRFCHDLAARGDEAMAPHLSELSKEVDVLVQKIDNFILDQRTPV